MNTTIVKISPFILLLGFFTFCSTPQDGWIDANTFKTSVTGNAHKKYRSLQGQKNSACRTAIRNAHYRIREEMCGSYTVKTKSGIKKRLKRGYIQRIKILQKLFNPATKKCIITFQVKKEDVRCR